MQRVVSGNSIVLVGGGGHCKVVIQVLQERKEYAIYGISDLRERLGQQILGIPINVADDELPDLRGKGVEYAFVTLGSVGNPQNRARLFDMLRQIGYSIPVIRSIHAVLSWDVEIGDGTVIMPGVIVNAGCRIGRNCILNTRSSIDHDCILGDHVHIAPGAVLSGGVRIGRNTHIGSASVVIQSIAVGSDTIVGAGSVVVKDVPAHTKVYGNPARVREALS